MSTLSNVTVYILKKSFHYNLFWRKAKVKKEIRYEIVVSRKVFAQRLKILREKRGLTVSELGKLVKVSGRTISGWEEGQTRIKSEYLIRIAEIFSVSVDYLLGLED